MHSDLRMTIRSTKRGTFDADGPVAQRRALGAHCSDSYVLDHHDLSLYA